MIRIASVIALTAVGLLASPPPALAGCSVETLAQLPVTMSGPQPLVAARINGRPAIFMADSGAFFSTITSAKAVEYGLKVGPAPVGMRVEGVGGAMEKIGIATLGEFTIANQAFARSFLVGGSETGQDMAGVIGQNILGFADVEYDLAHGMIQLTRTHDCLGRPLAYWAGGQEFHVVTIEAAPARRTIGDVAVNGVTLRALFDTGASASGISITAARRAGLDPTGPGVVDGGLVSGIGRHTVRSWIAPVRSLRIGDEEVRNTRLRITDMTSDQADMLIGADFFLSHHVYVANDQRKLYFTYNGGPVFNLDAAPQAGSMAGEVATSQAAEPTDAASFSRRGVASTSRRDYKGAVADLTRALALDPNEARYLFERARAHAGQGEAGLALADLDSSLAKQPGQVDALVLRAELRPGPDQLLALADLNDADRLAPREADVRLRLAELYGAADALPPAIAQYDAWIAAHPQDSRRAEALAARCQARGLANLDIDKALADCDMALKLDPKVTEALGARGLAHLRQHRFDEAVADFEAALAARPKSPLSLYGRGLARRGKGLTVAGDADIAAAVALRPNLPAEAKSHGLAP